MVRINVPLPESTWIGLRRMAEERRVHGRASISTLIADLLTGLVGKADEKSAA
jgi:hypothetical protein